MVRARFIPMFIVISGLAWANPGTSGHGGLLARAETESTETAPAQAPPGGRKKSRRKKKSKPPVEVVPAATQETPAPPAEEPAPPVPAPQLSEPEGPGTPAVEPEPTVRTLSLDDPDRRAHYAAGLRLRYISVPGWILGAFTDQNMPLHNLSLAGEFIRRRGMLDIVFSLDLSFYSPGDGNWLGNGRNPGVDVDYVQFRNFNLLSMDVSFIWHKPLTARLQLEYGLGIGIGFPMGNILRTSAGSPGCVTDPGDPTKCYPILCQPGPGPCSEQSLAASMQTGHSDSAVSPRRFVDDNVPPVIPVVNLLAGLVYQASSHVRLRVEAGFRNALFLGMGSEYQF